jgi:uncharacterized protein (DUF2237 family)
MAIANGGWHIVEEKTVRIILLIFLIFTHGVSAMAEEKIKDRAKNILGTELQSCCTEPMKGFFRDGYCNTNQMDQGTHVVCAIVTDEFLDFTRSRGNDLSTPRPEFQFPGLKSGDGWCLCALRWKEAYEAGVAPPLKPEATHKKVLDFISKETLEKHYIQ